MVSREKQDELANAIPDSALLVYADAGHTSRWDDPARLSHDFASFARRAQD